ncbi:MAG TPA: YceI family protein [Cyclobacteriaceae bacterium]|nr:YceI family protein [Cyclobacteriaceae bacterium]
MKRTTIITIMILAGTSCFAQAIYMTRSGQISFFSKTPMENIEAINNEVSSMINGETGEIVFAVLIKSFRFEKALMEEHFNENYMESSKIPKAMFQGKIINSSSVDFKKDGSYPVTAEGDLTLHGIKQPVQVSGTISIKNGKIIVTSEFSVKLEDYKIERPSLVADKISETIAIKINCQYERKS